MDSGAQNLDICLWRLISMGNIEKSKTENKDGRVYDYKTLRLENRDGDWVVIRELPFYDIMRFQEEFLKIDENENENEYEAYNEIIQKYFIEDCSKPYREFSRYDQESIAQSTVDLNMTGGYLNNTELMILAMTIQYKMDPVHIMNLPASWGNIMMAGMEFSKAKRENPIKMEDVLVSPMEKKLQSNISGFMNKSGNIFGKDVNFDDIYKMMSKHINPSGANSKEVSQNQ